MQADRQAFLQRLAQCGAWIEDELGRMLSAEERGNDNVPARLLAAMRHGALGGGKRLRPFLLIESAAMLGLPGEKAVRAAAALECVHCYSLIHDDLPAMDDDDLRRGKPTVHRAFDEATAILAGDSLLTFAFEILADPATAPDPAIRLEMIGGLARAAGMAGMTGGQMLDLANEGRVVDTREIAAMQEMKTGALIRFACEAGAALARAGKKERAALSRYGDLIGRAFQLADDILDATASTASLGKRAAKDERHGKATQVALLGIDEARRMALELAEQACAELSLFGPGGAMLRAAARFTVDREY